MKHFNSVEDILQRLILNIFLIPNGFSNVLRLGESLVTVISDATYFYFSRVPKLRSALVKHNHDVVLLSAIATFKRNTLATFKTLQYIQIVLMWCRRVRLTILLISMVRIALERYRGLSLKVMTIVR